jgi:hypothetical protein
LFDSRSRSRTDWARPSKRRRRAPRHPGSWHRSGRRRTIIGIFDLLTAAKTAIVEPAWQAFGLEVFVVVAAIYFLFCFAMSRYSQRLETELSRQKRE